MVTVILKFKDKISKKIYNVGDVYENADNKRISELVKLGYIKKESKKFKAVE